MRRAAVDRHVLRPGPMFPLFFSVCAEKYSVWAAHFHAWAPEFYHRCHVTQDNNEITVIWNSPLCCAARSSRLLFVIWHSPNITRPSSSLYSPDQSPESSGLISIKRSSCQSPRGSWKLLRGVSSSHARPRSLEGTLAGSQQQSLRTDGQTDGRTPYRFIDPAMHITLYAGSISEKSRAACRTALTVMTFSNFEGHFSFLEPLELLYAEKYNTQ